MRTSLTGPELSAPAAIPVSSIHQAPAPPDGRAILDVQPLSEARCCQGHPGTFGQVGRPTTRREWPIPCHNHGQTLAVTWWPVGTPACEADALPATSPIKK